LRHRHRSRSFVAGIVVVGFTLGIGVTWLTAEPNRPYAHDLLVFDRIGGVATFGTSIAYLGVVASQWGFRKRREAFEMGELLGISTAVLRLLTALGVLLARDGLYVDNTASWLFVGYWYAALCLVQLFLSTAAAGLLVAKLFTRLRPGHRAASPWTATAGFFLCALTGPFIAWQFVQTLTDL
jgi:hypothetical protein